MGAGAALVLSAGGWPSPAGASGSHAAISSVQRRRWAPDAPDVVMLVLDDQNDGLGYLGNPVAVTPNLDRLARHSGVFSHAYSQVAMCVPSRVTTLFGVTPMTAATHGRNGQVLRETGRCGVEAAPGRPLESCVDVFMDRNESLVDAFRQAGYHTLGAGKVYSPFLERSGGPYVEWNSLLGPELRESWNSFPEALAEDAGAARVAGSQVWWSYVTDPVRAAEHYEYSVASWFTSRLVEYLGTRRELRAPVFASAGMVQPHAPWRIPIGFRLLYEGRDALIDELLHDRREADRDLGDVPDVAHRRVLKPARLDSMDADDRTGGKRRESALAYLAAVSFTDAALEPIVDLLVGSRMTNAERDAAYGRHAIAIPEHPYYRLRDYRSVPAARRSVVAVWSDHGLHFGEKQTWGKGTLWERGTRIPMLIRDGREGDSPAGRRLTDGTVHADPVSLLGLVPTLCDLTGVPGPETIEGESLVPQVIDSSKAQRNPAAMVWGRGNMAIRWKNWRLIRYSFGRKREYRPPSLRYYERAAGDRRFPLTRLRFELYDIASDPTERRNLAHPRHYSERRLRVLRRLSAKLDRYEMGASRFGPRTRLGAPTTRLDVWEQIWVE